MGDMAYTPVIFLGRICLLFAIGKYLKWRLVKGGSQLMDYDDPG